ELRGNFTPHPHSSNLRLFCQIPSRCQIRLRNVLPESALDSNHVFLGLSRCGQFLLSYTYTTELDVMSLNEVYKYRLHWWAYVPNQKVRKVSEVMLFGNQSVHSILYIAVCQWPMDHSRLPGTWNTPPPERSFITITTVPSLNKCQDCLKVAASYEEEDLAASWDSCVRFSCLKHGLTVHTSFDVVSPFPKFEPSICMKRAGTVVFNTGNFLHVLKAELEHLCSGNANKTYYIENNRISIDDDFDEEFYGVDRERYENKELNITCGMNATTSEELFSVVTLMSPNPAIPATGLHNSGTNNIHNKIAEAEKAYEFTDDGLEPGCEKLSSFRRRRLADKKYEFCEEGEDAENIVPYRLTRRREMSPRLKSPPLYLPSSPLLILASDIHPITQMSNHIEADKVVLRPLNRNTAAVLLSPRDRENNGDWVKTSPPAVEHNTCDNSCAARCTVQLKRRYIEVDDELVSVITDIEDDDFSESTGYHCALPLEVHGAGYVQLQMISNSKAGKLMAPCVLVHQRSFDVEQFCHEIAERLCVEAGKKYWFCNDYDVEIIDVCPFSGDVIAVALMRIQATIKTKGLAKSQSLERQQYQGSCKFVWNVDTGHYAVVWTRPLHRVDPNDDMDPWNPARDIAVKLRENINHVPMCQTVKTISNELVLRGISLVKISDLDNLTELTL
ncbi:hypothetical protein L9F63_015278, partial [Diploptera punctata]